MTGWTMYSIYYAYWNDYNYADTFITKDYSATVKDAGASQLIKKGASYQAVWMYVLHKLESAISGCKAGNSNAVHSWDEGWAYYAGSLVGVTAADAVTERGVLLWELAEKATNDFQTGHSTGPATANVEALAAAIAGRDDILAATCTGLADQLKIITKQMTIPLIQSTIKYAWRADPAMTGSDCPFAAGTSAMTTRNPNLKCKAGFLNLRSKLHFDFTNVPHAVH